MLKKTFINRDPKNNKVWITQGAAVALHYNVTKYPFTQKEFRKAIAMAINKERIAKLATFGYTPPAHPTALQPGHIDEWFYKPLQPLVYSYNPTESVKILEELGLKKKIPKDFL